MKTQRHDAPARRLGGTRSRLIAYAETNNAFAISATGTERRASITGPYVTYLHRFDARIIDGLGWIALASRIRVIVRLIADAKRSRRLGDSNAII